MYSLYQTTLLSIKMLIRNKRRALVMSLGITLAIALVVGVFSYIDYSQNQVIERSVSNISIDMSVFQPSGSTNSNELSDFQNYLSSYQYPSFIKSTELILGTASIGVNRPGALVGTGDNLSINFGGGFRDNPGAGLTGANISIRPATILAFNESYFENFPEIFKLSSNDSVELSNSTIYVSQPLAASLDLFEGSTLNVSIQTLSFPGGISLDTYKAFNVSGIVNVDRSAYQNAINSFIPQDLQSSGGFGRAFQTFSELIVFMNLNTFQTFVTNNNQININVLQMKLDHNQLGADVQSILTQINQLENYISLQYFDSTIISNLVDQINLQADQLNNLRLTLLYLAIPSIFIGFYLTKYATDLVLMERKKELTAFRAKSLSQVQIRNYIVIESFATAGIGTVLGLLIGWIASIVLNNLRSDLSQFNLVISQESILLALATGIILSILSGINTARSVMNISIIEGLHEINSKKVVFWKKFYLDYLLLGIGIIFTLMNYLDFNPIPGFAQAAFNLIVPLCAWVGFALFLVRILETIIIKLEPILSEVLSKVLGEIGFLIGKDVSRKPGRVSQLTIILILILSFGVIIGTLSDTYSVNDAQQAQFMVGSDLRVQLPSINQLTFNVSDFQQKITSTIPDLQMTPIYIQTVALGRFSVVLIGIDLNTFLNVATFSNSYLKSGNSQEMLNSLKYDPNNPKIVISNTIANPIVSSDGGRFNFQQRFQSQFSSLDIGNQVPVRINSQLINVTIVDIAYYFPAILDVLNLQSSNVNFAIVDYKLLSEPITGLNGTITQNTNASILLGKFASNNNQSVVNNAVTTINSIYNQNYDTNRGRHIQEWKGDRPSNARP
ncbi:MAG: FtsX-like permease family protein, partial [Candidatus Thorarchaeota archaeon]